MSVVKFAGGISEFFDGRITWIPVYAAAGNHVCFGVLSTGDGKVLPPPPPFCPPPASQPPPPSPPR